MTFNELVTELVLLGIDVTLTLRDGAIAANLNFQTKSEGTLVDRDGTLVILGRYDVEVVVTSVEDCASTFTDFQYGRPYGNSDWVSLAETFA